MESSPIPTATELEPVACDMAPNANEPLPEANEESPIETVSVAEELARLPTATE